MSGFRVPIFGFGLILGSKLKDSPNFKYMASRVMLNYLSILIISLSATAAFSQTRLACNNGEVTFTSDAPLELIKASSHQLNGILDIESRRFAFSVESNSFEGFNSPLQKTHFKENYMESHTFPVITFSGRIIESDIFQEMQVEETIRAKGMLSIHGVEQERIIKCHLTNQINGDLEVRSKFSVSLAEHNIRIPKIVHQKIANDIEIEVTIVLSPQ